MTPDEVLSVPPRVLTQAQRDSYFEQGYLLVERIVPESWLQRLRAVTDAMVERSRAVAVSDSVWDLEEGHSAEAPRLRRLSCPNDRDPAYWEFASQSLLPDIVADLVGPNVKFHHSKLNFKWSRGGEEVKWHQDIGFYPHTNYSPLAAGLYLHDCTPEQGPLAVVRGSHEGPLYDQYNDGGDWVGCLSRRDAAGLDSARMVELDGPAGSITLHNCRTVHGSRPNTSERPRPLLINAYSAADAFPYTPNALESRYDQTIVRGGPVRWAHHDPRPCPIPPDWSGGYTSIFALQQEEGRAHARGAGTAPEGNSPP